jgi:hypothetical protein
MSHPATLADLRQHMQAAARKRGGTFTRPDDDWEMVMVVQSLRGLEVMPIPNDAMESGATKAVFAEAMRMAMVSSGVFRYALLLNTYAVKVAKLDPAEAEDADITMLELVSEEKLRVADLPGAYEQLTLTVGDAETEEMWVSRIKRHPTLPPRLGPWEKQEGERSGRFVDLGSELGRLRPPADRD